MAEFYIRTFDLTKLLLSYEKDHLDVIGLSLTDPDDDPECGGPPSLVITGVNSSDPDICSEEFVDSDESLSNLF